MDATATRLECLRIAANLRITHSTKMPIGLVPAIIADASAFADFALGDDDYQQPLEDVVAAHRRYGSPISKADIADHIDLMEGRKTVVVRGVERPDWTTRSPVSDDPRPFPGDPFFTGGFRDGPASEP